MEILRLKHIDKSYKLSGGASFPALRDISLSFRKGELISIIGESGSGKSTLMNIIGGLDSDFTGDLFFDGENISLYTEKQLDEYRKNKIGFIFQSINLIPHLSVLDNVTIAMTLSNVGKEERIKRASEILEQVGLKDHLFKKPNQLSGGQKQRVAIARALINDPDIIIADEPTGALDSETTEHVLSIIKTISKRGKLVIIVTHSDRVAAHSTRIIKIADGKLLEDRKTRASEYNSREHSAAHIHKDKQNLSFPAAVKLAFLNMKEKIGRNLWVSLGASIGIMSVILMLSIGNGVKTYMNESMNNMVNPLVVEVNMPPAENGSDIDMMDPSMMMSMMGEQRAFEEADIKELSEIDRVESVEKGFNLLSFGSNTVSFKDKQSRLMMLSTVSSSLPDTAIKEGKMPGENEILLGEGIAEKLGKDLIGEEVEVSMFVNEQTYKAPYKVSGITSLGNEFSSMKIMHMNYDDLAKLTGENGFELNPTSLYLVAKETDDTDAIKQKIKKLGYKGSSQETMTAMVNEIMDVQTYVLAGISGVSLLVSAIMILVVLHISVVERTKEIGVLKAIGARRKDIKRIFVSEAFLIGLASGIIGVILCALISAIANVISNNYLEVDIVQIRPVYILSGILVSILISMLSGLLPANKAGKMDPVESLRRD